MSRRVALLCGLCFCASPLAAQEPLVVAEELRDLGIPVKEIVVHADAVVARLDYSDGDDSFSGHKDQVFETLVEQFPDSTFIRIELYEDGTFVFPLVGATRDIPEYLENRAQGVEEYPRVEVYLAETVPMKSTDPVDVDIGLGASTAERGGLLEVRTTPWWRGASWPIVVLAVIAFYGFLALFVAVVLVARKRARGSSVPFPLDSLSALEVTYSNGRREVVAFRHPRMGIGRHPSNALVIENGYLSGRHAEIAASEAGYVVRDLGSTNGTRVNDEKIVEKVLHVGDVIKLGPIRIVPRS